MVGSMVDIFIISYYMLRTDTFVGFTVYGLFLVPTYGLETNW